MAKSKVNYQSSVHTKTYAAKPLKQAYKKAVKQVVDTVAPGFNPKRTKNRETN